MTVTNDININDNETICISNVISVFYQNFHFMLSRRLDYQSIVAKYIFNIIGRYLNRIEIGQMDILGQRSTSALKYLEIVLETACTRTRYF